MRRLNSRWVLVVFFLVFGVCTVDTTSFKWAVLGVIAYSIPALSQLVSHRAVRYGSLWVGAFLVSQTIVSRYLPESDYKTLPPLLNMRVDVQEGLPGITGVQAITTDEKGFRTTRPIDYTDTGAYRVIAIGASTTVQVYLDDRRTWTHLLQEKLSEKWNENVEVINTGVSGLRARNHLATLKKIIGYHPDLVIFLIGINDWNWHIKKEFRDHDPIDVGVDTPNKWFLKHTMLGSSIRRGWKAVSIASDRNNTPTTRIDRGEYYADKRGSLARATKLKFRPDTIDAEYEDMLLQISDACLQAGIDCVFVTQPTGYSEAADEGFRKGMWMTPPNQVYTLDLASMIHISSLYNNYLISFAKSRGHLLCDVAPAMEASYDHFYDDCHFNQQGAAVFAARLADCIAASLDLKRSVE